MAHAVAIQAQTKVMQVIKVVLHVQKHTAAAADRWTCAKGHCKQIHTGSKRAGQNGMHLRLVTTQKRRKRGQDTGHTVEPGVL